MSWKIKAIFIADIHHRNSRADDSSEVGDIQAERLYCSSPPTIPSYRLVCQGALPTTDSRTHFDYFIVRSRDRIHHHQGDRHFLGVPNGCASPRRGPSEKYTTATRFLIMVSRCNARVPLSPPAANKLTTRTRTTFLLRDERTMFSHNTVGMRTSNLRDAMCMPARSLARFDMFRDVLQQTPLQGLAQGQRHPSPVLLHHVIALADHADLLRSLPRRSEFHLHQAAADFASSNNTRRAEELRAP